jgi:RNAse (barnase) inhibitor barstar
MSRMIFGDFRLIDARDTVLVQIPEDLASFDELSIQIKEQLGLPDYYGNNWNALSDCLRDLHWVSEHRVIFVNAGRVFKQDWQWKTYLEVLKECVDSWKETDEHSFIVYFPETLREEVESIIE